MKKQRLKTQTKKWLCIASLITPCCISNAMAQGGVCFTPATNFAIGITPCSVSTADFNGDGKIDLVTANQGSSNVSVLLGNGAGGFATATNFAVGAGPTSVSTADFNGDGKIDLATANYNSDNVSVLLGNGAGGFAPATNFAVGAFPYSVSTADFNGDGRMDLVTANQYGDNVSVLLGNGAGGFATATNFAVGTNPRSVSTADFNGDGKMDLATANWTNNNVSVLLGNGAGGFSPATNFAVGTNPRSVSIADFNGDGKIDLVIANYNSNNVSVLLGDGAGGFAPATNFAVGLNPISVSTSDFNGDGKIDLVTANGSSNVSVLLGDGVGGFAPATNFAVGISPASVTTADFNGDGRMDLVTANQYGDNVSVLLNSNILPVITAAATQDTICYGYFTTLTGSGGSTYVWDNGVTNGIAFVPSAVGTTTYTVIGRDTIGCSNTAFINVTVNPLPTVVANASATIICAGDSVVLTGSGSANTYTWDYGVSNGVAFYPTAGSSIYYTVTGTDANNCSNTAFINVTVNPLPTVVANTTATTICAGESIMLTGSGSANTYIWDNGVSNGASYYPPATTTYTVTGTDANNCSDTASINITVNPLPTVNIFSIVACDSTLVPVTTFTSNPTGGTFTWANSNTAVGLNSNGTGNLPSFVATNSGTYPITSTVTVLPTLNYCTGNAVPFTITVNPTPLTPIILNAGGILTSNATSGNQWYLNDTLLVGATSQNYTPTVNGVYTVVVTLNNCNSSASDAIVYTSVGIDELKLTTKIVVYPNPSSGIFTLTGVPNSSHARVNIYNTLGKLVYTSKLNAKQVEINLSSKPKGIYFIRLLINEKSIIKKLVLKN